MNQRTGALHRGERHPHRVLRRCSTEHLGHPSTADGDQEATGDLEAAEVIHGTVEVRSRAVHQHDTAGHPDGPIDVKAIAPCIDRDITTVDVKSSVGVDAIIARDQHDGAPIEGYAAVGMQRIVGRVDCDRTA